MTQPEAHAVVQRWVIPWLEREVRGDTTFDAFLLPGPHPGVVVEIVE